MIKRLRIALIALIVTGCQAVPVAVGNPAQNSGWRVPDVAFEYERLMIRSSLAEFGHDEHVALLAAQTHQESIWRNDLVSRVGAIGPSQFMPSTARDRLNRRNKGLPCAVIDDFKDYACALPSQIRYMADLRRSVRGAVNECERMAMATAKYNGGGIRADRRLAETNGHDYGRWFNHTELFNGRNRASYNFKENRHYPRRIILDLQHRFLKAGYRGEALCLEHI